MLAISIAGWSHDNVRVGSREAEGELEGMGEGGREEGGGH